MASNDPKEVSYTETCQRCTTRLNSLGNTCDRAYQAQFYLGCTNCAQAGSTCVPTRESVTEYHQRHNANVPGAALSSTTLPHGQVPYGLAPQIQAPLGQTVPQRQAIAPPAAPNFSFAHSGYGQSAFPQTTGMAVLPPPAPGVLPSVNLTADISQNEADPQQQREEAYRNRIQQLERQVEALTIAVLTQNGAHERDRTTVGGHRLYRDEGDLEDDYRHRLPRPSQPFIGQEPLQWRARFSEQLPMPLQPSPTRMAPPLLRQAPPQYPLPRPASQYPVDFYRRDPMHVDPNFTAPSLPQRPRGIVRDDELVPEDPNDLGGPPLPRRGVVRDDELVPEDPNDLSVPFGRGRSGGGPSDSRGASPPPQQ